MSQSDPISRLMWSLIDHLLSSPPESRLIESIHRILPWLRSRSPMFHNLKKEILIDIATNATLRKVKKDFAIVWQGQKGKYFHIILKGAASVHSRKDQTKVMQQDSLPVIRGKDRQGIVGPELSGLQAGSSFGEMVMTRDLSQYNATVIADELTHVLLIDEALYKRSFSVHNLEWKEKAEFVDQSPLFKNLSPAIKNLLVENLFPVEVQFGNRFVKQGTKCNSLFFIRRGWGKVIADARLSTKQYETMTARSKGKDYLSGRKSATYEREQPKTKDIDPCRPLSVIEKRRHRQEYGYVAIETLLRHRESSVTTTGPNDVIGDIEIILGLPAYCASVECVENVTFYELSKYNFSQIIEQRCSGTYRMLREGVLAKLHYRSQRLGNFPLYSLLYENALKPRVVPKKERRSTTFRAEPVRSLWKEKVVEQQRIKAALATSRKSNAATVGTLVATVGTKVSFQVQSASAPPGGESQVKEPSSSGREKTGEESRPDKKGKKQYTVEEFRVLKKKMQAQIKNVLRKPPGELL